MILHLDSLAVGWGLSPWTIGSLQPKRGLNMTVVFKHQPDAAEDRVQRTSHPGSLGDSNLRDTDENQN